MSAGAVPSHDDFTVGRPLVRPVVFDRAFDDPEHVRDVLNRNGPYEWIGLRNGWSAEPSETPLMPWFRQTWEASSAPAGGRSVILDNPLFIEGSRESFAGFELVRPESVRINLMTPMPDQGPHFDNPYFRGLDHSNAPYYLLITMGRSELFERWAINVSSALAWLYDGDGGGFTYWVDGPDRPPQRIAPPMDNRALISDNQRMYHRVEAIAPNASAEVSFYDPHAVMTGEGRHWTILERDKTHILPREHVRISLLWKAVMFRDAQEMRVHDEHLDDLTLDRAMAVLAEGARAKGVTLPRTDSPYGDETYRAALYDTFPPRGDFAPPATAVR
jgi:hypothetical protein